jgi:signal transduction histidine kinase
MAWIGLVNRDTGDINVASQFGYEDGYLSLVRITIDSNAPGGRGPTGTAIRENRYIINNNTEESTYMAPWRDEAIRRGYLSSAAFPIREHKQVIGALTVYISEPDYFEKDEIELAQEIVDGISFAVDGFDLKQQRKQGEEEKKRLEEQLHQSQKMESIGLLAGGVAHDFNNILSAIVGYGYMAQQQLKDDAATGGYIQEILDSANRASELTRGLLAFSRKQVIAPVLVDLNEIVRKIEKMLGRIIREDIKLSTVLSTGELPVLVDTGQMEQVLINLATNARDAMPDGGDLVIKTEAVHVDSHYSEAHFFQSADEYAVLTISDTGVGMDQGTKENIFEPFFTTKEVGKGTGLGLSIAYGIIKQHNGNIRVYSEAGQGTTFKIYLPMAEEGRETIFEPKIETPPEGKGETIIVAEDEPQVRKSLRLILQRNGYKIIEAENGEDAVRKFQENRSAVSLILLDVIMPVKNGREAYEKIKSIAPSVKTIFMSGYTDDIITKKGLLEEGFDLISKPINPDALVRKIRDVLDR